jgi:hypothetical protein
MSEPVLDPASLRAIAQQVAELLRRRDSSDDATHALLTAGQVAARFNVDRTWVYAHAGELGVVRLGSGRRPRLRFDPAIVAQHLLAAPPQTLTRTAPRAPAPGSAPLLPIKRGRARRSLH